MISNIRLFVIGVLLAVSAPALAQMPAVVDGQADETEVDFDLCWLNHTGKQSAVLVIGDTN